MHAHKHTPTHTVGGDRQIKRTTPACTVRYTHTHTCTHKLYSVRDRSSQAHILAGGWMGSRQGTDKFAVNVIPILFFVINHTAPLPEQNVSQSMWQEMLQILSSLSKHLFRFPLFRSINAESCLFRMDSSPSYHPAALTQNERKSSSGNFLPFFFLRELPSLTPKFLSWRQRYWGPCLTDVLWHGLSSADVRTAEGFDSVRFRYPVPSGVDQNRHLSQRR